MKKLLTGVCALALAGALSGVACAETLFVQAGKLLAEIVGAKAAGLPMEIIDEAIRLNHALVHQPFAKDNLSIRLSYDLLDYWHKVRGGEQALLSEKPLAI